ncbi:hypothetical protein BAY61_29560 [Prauserella marina]|uniref:Uncharacterized protein n=1 Tax=Prauserella marina TaxID=530584 RepID=A0A222VXB4_9PSEU|nr:hypothetical protein [Prauserella marina]ASR38462.1 hypothetical protein BAY61_29560 [Prauserella marina]PWV78294.1 hypothetical protein DES30_10423 [Prauserella marina]SDC82770.1 hypothetical protein SAMN05421630_10423 [Prauserella marina]
MSSASLPPIVELRSSDKTKRGLAIGLAVGGVALVAATVLRLGTVGLYATVPLFLAIFIPVTLHVLRLRVVLTHTQVGKAGMLGKLKMHQRADVNSALRVVFPPPPRGRHGPVPTTFLVDHHGFPLLRLRDNDFGQTRVDEFVNALGIKVHAYPGIMTMSEFNERHPDYLAYWERKPTTLGLFIGCGLVVAIVAGAAIATIAIQM